MSWPLLDQNEKKYEFDWAIRDQHEQMCEALSVLDNRLVRHTQLHLKYIYRKFEKHQSPTTAVKALV